MSVKVGKINTERFISENSFKVNKENQNISKIIKRVYSGDMSAFNHIDISYRDHLLNVAFKKNRDRNYAKDLVQDSIKSVLIDMIGGKFNELGEEDAEKAVLSQLFKSVSYMSIAIGSGDVRHKNKFENKTVYLDNYEEEGVTIEDIADESMNRLDEITSSEQLSLIQRAIEHLNHRERRIIEMSFYKRNTIVEIGEELNISKGSVSNYMSYGLGNLRKMLKK